MGDETDTGQWNNAYGVCVPFKISGRQFIFGHKIDNTGGAGTVTPGYWFVQELKLPDSEFDWIEVRGENGYCYYELNSDITAQQLVKASKTINVDNRAAFLLAVLSKNKESSDFPKGARLEIISPFGGLLEGIADNLPNSLVIKSDLKPQGQIIKEPEGGNYKIDLTVPAGIEFRFAFQTLPFIYEFEVVGDQRLQKRSLGDWSFDEHFEEANNLALLLDTANRERQSVQLPEQAITYTTGGQLDPHRTPLPGNVPALTNLIVNYAFVDATTPPSPPTPAPNRNTPVIRYVQNPAGALLWLHARIEPRHLGMGSPTNNAMRTFAQGLGLQSDDAGHVIGRNLGGLGTVDWNIFPQNPNFNRGTYRENIEGALEIAVNNSDSVEVWFDFHYGDPLHPNRPSSFTITWHAIRNQVIIQRVTENVLNPH